MNIGGARRNLSEKNEKQKLITFCSKQKPFTEMKSGKQLGSHQKTNSIL